MENGGVALSIGRPIAAGPGPSGTAHPYDRRAGNYWRRPSIQPL